MAASQKVAIPGAGQSRLELLPPEILDLILFCPEFFFSYPRKTTPHSSFAIISSTLLLYFTRVYHYQNSIHSTSQLKKLINSVAFNPSLGSHLIKLDINLNRDEEIIEMEELENFLLKATHLESFAVSGKAMASIALREMITSPHFAERHGKTWKKLSIRNTLESLSLMLFDTVFHEEIQDSTAPNGQVDFSKSLNKFTSLETLIFGDGIILTEKLIDTISRIEFYKFELHQSDNPDFTPIKKLLDKLDHDTPLETLGFFFEMDGEGVIGDDYEDGAKIMLDAARDKIIPSDWELPDWGMHTKEEAAELSRLAKKKGIILEGPIEDALWIEEGYEQEMKWCDKANEVLRTRWSSVRR